MGQWERAGPAKSRLLLMGPFPLYFLMSNFKLQSINQNINEVIKMTSTAVLTPDLTDTAVWSVPLCYNTVGTSVASFLEAPF